MIPLIDKALEDYAAQHSSPSSPLRDELQAYTYAHCDSPQMVTGRLEAALLQMLVMITNARRVLEVGTFTGYSALAMAEVLPADGRVITCEIDAERAKIAQSFFDRSAVGSKVEIKLAPARKTLATLADTPAFDLAFIDADKENYKHYYEDILPLLRPGGLLVADNVLWSGRVLNPVKETDRAIVAFNDLVTRDDRVDHVLLTVRDGVMVVRKR